MVRGGGGGGIIPKIRFLLGLSSTCAGASGRNSWSHYPRLLKSAEHFPFGQNFILIIMTLFRVGQPGHWSPDSETLFGPKCIRPVTMPCVQLQSTSFNSANLNRIQQSKYLRDSRDSQQSARTTQGSKRTASTRTFCLISAWFLRIKDDRNTAVQEQSVNCDIDPYHDACKCTWQCALVYQ